MAGDTVSLKVWSDDKDSMCPHWDIGLVCGDRSPTTVLQGRQEDALEAQGKMVFETKFEPVGKGLSLGHWPIHFTLQTYM